MRTRKRIIDRRPECSQVKDPTHRYQFSIAEGRQIDALNPFRNIREVPYERALKLFATRRLR